jgi:hypothetical protein
MKCAKTYLGESLSLRMLLSVMPAGIGQTRGAKLIKVAKMAIKWNIPHCMAERWGFRSQTHSFIKSKV